MHKATCLLLPMLLAGCGLIGKSNVDAGLVLTGKSNKSAQLFTECVLNGWNAKAETPIYALPTATGYTAQINDMESGVVMQLAVTQARKGAGSEFKFHKKNYVSYYETVVFDCK